MEWAALITWLLTAAAGFALLLVWVSREGMSQSAPGNRIRARGVSGCDRSAQLATCERNHTKIALKTRPPVRTLRREEEAGESAPLIGAARSRVVLGKASDISPLREILPLPRPELPNWPSERSKR